MNKLVDALSLQGFSLIFPFLNKNQNGGKIELAGNLG